MERIENIKFGKMEIVLLKSDDIRTLSNKSLKNDIYENN